MAAVKKWMETRMLSRARSKIVTEKLSGMRSMLDLARKVEHLEDKHGTDITLPCRETMSDIFMSQSMDCRIAAEKACMGCPFKLDCLVIGVQSDGFGTWGGQLIDHDGYLHFPLIDDPEMPLVTKDPNHLIRRGRPLKKKAA